MATRLKLVTDPNTGTSAWYREGDGELFIQCAYYPLRQAYDFCAPPPDIPIIDPECGTHSLVLSSSSGSEDVIIISSSDGGEDVISSSSSFSSSFSSSYPSSSSSVFSSSWVSSSSFPSSSVISSSFGPVTLSFIGSTPGVQIKYRSLVKDVNGNLHAAPYGASTMMKITTSTDFVDVTNTVTGITTVSSKWIDGVAAPNGKNYFSPHSAPGYLIQDLSTNPPTLSTVGGAYQVRSSALSSSGVIHSPPYSYTASDTGIVRRLDTNTDTMLANIPYSIDRTGPIYSARANWEAENTAYYALYDRYWGAVTAPNGKIYGIPFGSDRILIIDPVAETAVQGSDLLNGNDPIPSDPDPIDLNNSPYFQKYGKAAVSSINGCIYAMPRHAKSILKIDPSDDSAVEIPLPPPLDGSPALSKSFVAVEASDGRIFSSPWQLRYLFWIDPTDDSIGYQDINADLTANAGTTNNFYTYAVADGDSIYYSPGSATKVLKITV